MNQSEQDAQQEPRKRGGWLLSVAKFALAFVLIYFLLRRGDIEPMQLKAALTRYWFLSVLVMVLMALSYMGQAFRWDIILRERDIRVPYFQALRYLMIGKFFNLAVPGYFSEDIVRGLYLIRSNASPRSKVLMSLMADRLVGIMSLFLVCATGLVLRSLSSEAADARLVAVRTLSVAATLGAAGVVLMLRRFPDPPALLRALAGRLRLGQAFDSVYHEVHYYCRAGRLQAKLIGVSLVNHTLMVSSFVVFGHALGMRQVTLADYCIFVPLGVLVTMIPIAPIGLGVGHVAFLTLFKIAGSSEGANLFSLYTAVCIILSLLGGLFYLGVGKAKEAPRAMAASAPR